MNRASTVLKPLFLDGRVVESESDLGEILRQQYHLAKHNNKPAPYTASDLVILYGYGTDPRHPGARPKLQRAVWGDGKDSKVQNFAGIGGTVEYLTTHEHDEVQLSSPQRVLARNGLFMVTMGNVRIIPLVAIGTFRDVVCGIACLRATQGRVESIPYRTLSENESMRFTERTGFDIAPGQILYGNATGQYQLFTPDTKFENAIHHAFERNFRTRVVR